MTPRQLGEQAQEVATRLRENPSPGVISDAVMILEGCARQLGAKPRPAGLITGPSPTTSRASAQDANLRVLSNLKVMQFEEPPGSLLSVAKLRRRSRLDKPTFDAAMLRLAHVGAINLHHHDFPMSLSSGEREELVYDAETNTYYVGVAVPRENY